MQADIVLNCHPVTARLMKGAKKFSEIRIGDRRVASKWPAPQPTVPAMAVRTSACLPRLLPALVLIASIGMTISAEAQEQTRTLAKECATKDVAVVTLIEDHGAAGDVSADRLGKAALTMLDARMVCREGRVGEALALYESILDLKPAASLRSQRP